jgi:hypothetical protein
MANNDSGPTYGFVTSLEVDPGSLSVPCRSGTPHIGLSTRQGVIYTVTCPVALDHVFMLRTASALPRVPWHRIPPPCSGGLRQCHVPQRLRTPPPCSRGFQCCHVYRGSGPYLPARKTSGAATCPADLCGLQTSRINKGLPGLPTWLGSRVSKRACMFLRRLTPEPT